MELKILNQKAILLIKELLISMLTGSYKDCDKEAICRGNCYFTTNSKLKTLTAAIL
jgi:hypothetical protein